VGRTSGKGMWVGNRRGSEGGRAEVWWQRELEEEGVAGGVKRKKRVFLSLTSRLINFAREKPKRLLKEEDGKEKRLRSQAGGSEKTAGDFRQPAHWEG